MTAPSNTPAVAHCDTMADVRRHIDALDDIIVPLLAERSGYVAQAGRIKQHVDQIIDPERIEYIVARVRDKALAAGAPAEVIEATYRAMITAFCEFEHGEFVRLRQKG